MQRTLVVGCFFSEMTSDLRLEVIVIRVLTQASEYLNPGRFLHKKTEGVIGSCKLLNLCFAELHGELLLQGLKVLTDPRADHDSVGIDRLTGLSVPLAGADRTEKAVLRKYLHTLLRIWIEDCNRESPKIIRVERKYS